MNVAANLGGILGSTWGVLPGFNSVMIPGVSFSRDLAFCGCGFLAGFPPGPGGDLDGRLRIQNVPSKGRVLVYEQGTSYCVADVYSAHDGTWLVDRLDESKRYTIVAHDSKGLNNASIQDWVYPAPMEP